MLFYLVLLLCIACFSAGITYSKNPVITLWCKVITFLLIFLPIAFRYNVGVDYFNYIDIFHFISHQGATYIEPGYWWLNYFVFLLGGDAQTALAVSAFITLFFFFKDTEKEKWLIYSLLFFILIFAWCCSTIRQMISMALAFYAWKKYEKGQRFTAILCIVFAFLFHYSSILYPFIYLICKKININRTKAFILFFTALALSFIGKGWLTNLLATLLANTGYGSYTTSKWFDPAETESGLGMIVRYISYFSILLFFPIDKVKNGKFILALFTLYTVIDIISIQVTIINRIGRGFIFCYLPCIYYISTTQYKYRQIAVFLVWGILAVSFLRQLTTGFNHCAPYMSIFNN